MFNSVGFNRVSFNGVSDIPIIPLVGVKLSQVLTESSPFTQILTETSSFSQILYED